MMIDWCEKHNIKNCAICAADKDRIVPLSRQEAAKMLDEADGIMDRARACLNRFAGRYAESAHAKGQVKEARLIIQEIDEWRLRR